MIYDQSTTTSFVDSASEIGALVRTQRIAGKLTLSELAARAAVGRRFIVDVEAGKETVQADSLFKVCRALDLEVMIKRPIIPIAVSRGRLS